MPKKIVGRCLQLTFKLPGCLQTLSAIYRWLGHPFMPYLARFGCRATLHRQPKPKIAVTLTEINYAAASVLFHLYLRFLCPYAIYQWLGRPTMAYGQ